MSTEPIELTAKTTGNVVGFACGKCSCVTMTMFLGAYFGTDAERLEEARRAAIEHCGPWFCDCGKPREQYQLQCKDCRSAKWAADVAAREQARLDAAEKVDVKDWSGEYLWDEGSEDIYSHPDDLLDWYDGHDREPPTHAWDCDRHELHLDARDIIDAAVEQHEFHDEAADHVSGELLAELQAVLDAWCAKAKIHCWKPNGRAVMLPRRNDDEKADIEATT